MLYIIRHGQTDMNARHLLQGRSNSPLNPTGTAQAVAASGRLRGIPFRIVFSSPLERAVQTARIIVPNLSPILDERLTEMEYGPYEGTDLRHLPPELQTFFGDFVHQPAPAGMEPLSSVVQRTGAFLEEIRHIRGNILISTHAIAMKGMLEYLTPESNGAYWSRYIGTCAVYTVDNEGGRLGIPQEWK